VRDVSYCVSLTVSPSLCLPPSLPHCVSLTVSPSLCLSASLPRCEQVWAPVSRSWGPSCTHPRCPHRTCAASPPRSVNSSSTSASSSDTCPGTLATSSSRPRHTAPAMFRSMELGQDLGVPTHIVNRNPRAGGCCSRTGGGWCPSVHSSRWRHSSVKCSSRRRRAGSWTRATRNAPSRCSNEPRITPKGS
jgi:hypothetical protein